MKQLQAINILTVTDSSLNNTSLKKKSSFRDWIDSLIAGLHMAKIKKDNYHLDQLNRKNDRASMKSL